MFCVLLLSMDLQVSCVPEVLLSLRVSAVDECSLEGSPSLGGARSLEKKTNCFYVCQCRENRPREGGICVANHTSPLDVLILSSDGCYSLV